MASLLSVIYWAAKIHDKFTRGYKKLLLKMPTRCYMRLFLILISTISLHIR